LHENPFHEIQVGDLFAITCNRLFESLFFIENISNEFSVNFILRNTVKLLTEEETLLQTSEATAHIKDWLVQALT